MIYFIQNGDMVKIGYSDNPVVRMGALQTASSEILKLRLVIDGDASTELILHKRFTVYRSHHEWFRLEGSLLKFIEDNEQYAMPYAPNVSLVSRDKVRLGGRPKNQIEPTTLAFYVSRYPYIPTVDQSKRVGISYGKHKMHLDFMLEMIREFEGMGIDFQEWLDKLSVTEFSNIEIDESSFQFVDD